ncbi:unnamed protein product [Phytophthora lilii]|uniref:Unnamed protein product n=1 Tax=Phytophthora lilii TaxID=2077276 RepID=A0A9W6U778_9STRA|nr:unnamed protein product [Phytophthora lilii]
MEVWARAPFPIAKLLPVNIPASSAEAKPSEFSWICLGADGEIALFHGQKIVKQSHAASFNTAPEVELGLPVDFVMLNTGAQHQSGAIVFSDRVHTIPIELTA